MNAMVENNTPEWVGHVEKLINKALSLDEETLCSLAELEGKVIGFEFINSNLTLFLFPSIKGLLLLSHYENKADVLIKGTPTNFFMMIASSKTNSTSLPTDMQIIGDIGLAQRFQEIMQNIEIDFEEPLSKWVGDTLAHKIGRFVRRSHRFTINTSKLLASDISEYLRFEINMLPDELLVEEFSHEVDTLREDIERFQQRVKKLEMKIKEN